MTDHTTSARDQTRGPRPDIDALICESARQAMAAVIAENNGAEVFFVGKASLEGVIEEALPCAFGNDSATPAIARDAEEGDVVLHNHPTGHLRPSQADVAVAAALGDRSIGFYIIDNVCARIHVVVPAFEIEALTLLDPDRIEGWLGRDGVVARHLDRYEYRPQQLRMARLVCDAFNADAIAVIEAGTGTGKSMAYLAPALLWAVENRDKVVVSTNTINLQEQILRKDLPFLARALGLDFKAEIVKGRGQYLCLRKLTEAREQARDLFGDTAARQLQRLTEWSTVTGDGSLSDLTIPPDGDVWDEVKCEGDNCGRTRCPHYKDCFFYRSRRRASAAHILVVNHALLLTDMALRVAMDNYSESIVLPPYHRLIVDEGHNLEDAATGAFSASITARGLKRMCLRWFNPNRRGAGVLRLVIHRLYDSAEIDAPETVHEIQRIIHDVLTSEIQELTAIIDEVAERIEPELEAYLDREGDAGPSGGGRRQLRIVEAVRETSLWRGTVYPLTARLHGALQGFLEKVSDLTDALGKLSKQTRTKMIGASLQIHSHANKMRLIVAQLNGFLNDDPNMCLWLEAPGAIRNGTGRTSLRWCSAPIEMGPLMKKALVDPLRTVIITSATLTVNRRFDFLLHRLGLSQEEASDGGRSDAAPVPYDEADREWDPDAPAFAPSGRARSRRDTKSQPSPSPTRPPLILESIPSPFDYHRQALVAAPRNMPAPQSSDYEEAVGRCVERAARITRGRALVLCTSYSMVNRTMKRLRVALGAEGFTLLKQGDGGRHQLLETFRKSRRAILVATSSFWEGVDVQGDALSLLILTRLPFNVPSEPIMKARVEMIEKRGGDAFRDFSMPLAIIRFKQGFGRLIRSRTDKGCVMILDSRVISKSYGKMFLRSLPEHHLWKGREEDLWPEMKTFFGVGEEAQEQEQEGRLEGRAP